jgi:Tfp pilus assembly protein PilF
MKLTKSNSTSPPTGCAGQIVHLDSEWATTLRAKLLLVFCLLAIAQSGCQFAASGQNSRGVKLHEQGQYSAAMQQFQQAIQSNPRDPDGYYNLASTTHRLAIQRNDSRLVEQAESLYNQCLDLSPNHVECHRGLAVLLMESQRPDRAFALIKNWVATQPQLGEARVELARLYQEGGEVQIAQKHLEDAVSQDPKNSRAWLALAQIRENRGDIQQALANYQRSYALNTQQPAVLQRIAALNQRISSGVDSRYSENTRFANPNVQPNFRRY